MGFMNAGRKRSPGRLGSTVVCGSREWWSALCWQRHPRRHRRRPPILGLYIGRGSFRAAGRLRSIRLRDQPSRPSARTCCFFCFAQDLTAGGYSSVSVNVLDQLSRWPLFRCPPMAGFGCPPRVIQQRCQNSSCHQRRRKIAISCASYKVSYSRYSSTAAKMRLPLCVSRLAQDSMADP